MIKFTVIPNKNYLSSRFFAGANIVEYCYLIGADDIYQTVGG